jgi:hypothetical protein
MPHTVTVWQAGSGTRLGAEGLFREDGGKRFSLTPLADPLPQDAPQSIRPQAL